MFLQEYGIMPVGEGLNLRSKYTILCLILTEPNFRTIDQQDTL